MRKLASAMLAGMLLTTLTSCGAAVEGMVGISLDESGRLIAVLAWCGSPPVKVGIYHERTGGQAYTPSASPTRSYVRDADYHAPALKGQSASLRLDAPSDGWSVTPKPFTPEPGNVYRAYGLKSNGITVLQRVNFEAGDVAKLAPGQVLIQGWDEKIQDLSDIVIPLQEFERRGQDYPCR